MIKSFEKIDFSSIQNTDLLVLDVDETLMQGTTTVSRCADDQYYSDLNNCLNVIYYFSNEILTNFYSAEFMQMPRQLIEPNIVEKFSELQNRGVKVIACTAMQTGRYGLIERMEDWRYEDLKSLGINFENSFPGLDLNFPCDSTFVPKFYKGILCTRGSTKGDILKMFLESEQVVSHFKPTRVIACDDNDVHLHSLAEACKDLGAEFIGYHYVGSSALPWDEELVKFQALHWRKEGKFLSDAEAKLLMNK